MKNGLEKIQSFSFVLPHGSNLPPTISSRENKSCQTKAQGLVFELVSQHPETFASFFHLSFWVIQAHSFTLKLAVVRHASCCRESDSVNATGYVQNIPKIFCCTNSSALTRFLTFFHIQSLLIHLFLCHKHIFTFEPTPNS